jgi:hypothetical protein
MENNFSIPQRRGLGAARMGNDILVIDANKNNHTKKQGTIICASLYYNDFKQNL